MHSCYSSLILFFIPWAAMYDTVRDDGKDIADYQSFALLAQTCLLIVMNIQVRDTVPITQPYTHWINMCTRIKKKNFIFLFNDLFSAVSGHPLLDSSEPVLCLGKPGCLFCHHIHHVQQRHVPHLHLLFPLHRWVDSACLWRQKARRCPLIFFLFLRKSIQATAGFIFALEFSFRMSVNISKFPL